MHQAVWEGVSQSLLSQLFHFLYITPWSLGQRETPILEMPPPCAPEQPGGGSGIATRLAESSAIELLCSCFLRGREIEAFAVGDGAFSFISWLAWETPARRQGDEQPQWKLLSSHGRLCSLAGRTCTMRIPASRAPSTPSTRIPLARQ